MQAQSRFVPLDRVHVGDDVVSGQGDVSDMPGLPYDALRHILKCFRREIGVGGDDGHHPQGKVEGGVDLHLQLCAHHTGMFIDLPVLDILQVLPFSEDPCIRSRR